MMHQREIASTGHSYTLGLSFLPSRRKGPMQKLAGSVVRGRERNVVLQL